ncbi:MAG: IPT/TIG domain-containing protein [Myxococcota bacterium]
MKTGVPPEEGPVFIHGAGFRPDSTVVFATSVADEVVYRTPHLLEVVTPPTIPGLVDVEVRTGAGQRGRLDDAFFFTPPPTPEQVTPAQGPTAGGTRVLIQGRNFDPEVTFTFDDQPALEINWIDDTTVEAVTPPHPEGFVPVTATNPDGQSGTLDPGFRYLAPPQVFGVDPPAGPTAGGTVVTVIGQDFRPGLFVQFDGRIADLINVDSDTQLTAITPPHPAGTVDVTVTNDDGQTGLGRQIFTYLEPPLLLDVTPDSGETLGGDRVTLTGRGFFEDMVVTFDGLPCTDLQVQSATTATCLTPPHPVGLVDVTITLFTGQDTLEDGFRYVPPAPEILSIEPDRGPDLGGTRVIVTVRFLQLGAQVTFDGLPATITDLTLVDDIGTIILLTPPHPEGPVPVTVTNVDNLSDTVEDGYLYLGPPEILDIDPSEGPDTGGQQVVITGRNFVEGMTVTFDGLDATVVAIDVDRGTITVRTPPRPVGTVDVTVTTPEGRSDTAADSYTYIILPPVISAITPAEGPVWGGNTVTIEGEGFRDGVVVLVDGVPVATERVDGGLLRIVLPPGDEGVVTVEVVNPDGQSDDTAYTYVGPLFEPDAGLTSGFTTVTITGPGLTPDLQISFGGTPAEEITFISDTEVRAITPRGNIGARAIRITTSGGNAASFPAAFTYHTFTDATAQSGVPAETDCLATGVADLDGDGDEDLVVTNGTLFQGDNDYAANLIYDNIDDDIAFQIRTIGPEDNSMNVEFADIDNDGDFDVLVANLDGINRLYRNDNGNLNEITSRLPISRASYDAGFFDLNNDDAPDIILVNTSERDNIFINTGNGNFRDASDLLPPGNLSQHDHDYDHGDLDGDGREDLIFSIDNSQEGITCANAAQCSSDTAICLDSQCVRYEAVNRAFVTAGQGDGFARTDNTFGGYTTLDGDFLEARIVDITGDGLNDIVVVDNIDQSSPQIVPTTGIRRTSVLIYRNLCGGQFELATDLVPPASQPLPSASIPSTSTSMAISTSLSPTLPTPAIWLP